MHQQTLISIPKLKILSIITSSLYLSYHFYLQTSQQSVRESRHPRQTGCEGRLSRLTDQLRLDNISESCELLEQDWCETNLPSAILDAYPESVLQRSSSCEVLLPQFGRIRQEEHDFPLGFYITAYTDARNLEILLSTIFRPHNSYCIHVDSKAEPIFINTVRQLLSCYQSRYPNTFISLSSRSIPVYWGHYSIVEAELICLRDLLQADTSWRYAVNLAGSEMMLVTNYQLVQRLRSRSKESIFSMSLPMPTKDERRFKTKYKLDTKAFFDPEFEGDNPVIMIKETQDPDPVPFQLNVYKGIKSHRLPRGFVSFLLTHPVAQTFLNWSKTTFIPDEMVVPTLARISSVTLASEGWVVKQNKKPQFPSHLQYWERGKDQSCLGR